MSQKTTLRSKKSAAHVAWSARALAEQTSLAVVAKLQSLLAEGESMPDVVFFQELLGRYLDLRSRQLAEVDGRYTEEQRIGRVLRLERKRQIVKVRATLRNARHHLDLQVGKSESALHLKERNFTRRDAISLIQLSREAAIALRDPKVVWEPSTVTGVTSGSVVLAENLEREAELLEQLTQDQEGLQARLQQAGLAEKDAELEKAKVAIRGGANLLAGLYTFADLAFHAQRVRQRIRKSAASEEETPNGEQPTLPPKALVPSQEEVIVRLG